MPQIPVIQQDQYPATSDTQIIGVVIPSGDEYKWLLAGMIQTPASANNYADPDSAQAQGVAGAWADAISSIDWDELMTPAQQFNRGVYPWGWYFSVISGNVISWSDLSSQPFSGYWRQSPAAINNEVEAHFPLPTGIYRIDLYGVKATICGQQQIAWNGNAFPTVIDWYSATSAINTTVSPGYDITLTDNAGLTINSKMTGKNASATDYQLLLSWLIIRRTGDA